MRLSTCLPLLASLLSVFAYARDTCAIDPSAIVSDACTSYASLDDLNSDLSVSLNDALQSDFFAYYRLNLYKQCPYWNDETSMCGNRACAVDTIDNEEDVPLIWRAEELSKVRGARAEHPDPRVQRQRPKSRPLQFQLGEHVDESCVYEADDECDERDYCIPEDEGAAAKGDYVSLLNNTERFTGYSGPSAKQVWDSIYKENCFTSVPVKPRGKSIFARSFEAARDLRQVIQEYGRRHVGNEDDLYPLNDECLEQRAFYRIISGMHASISSHICWDYFNQTTGEWVRNLECYKDRLHKHPERVSNLYFNYALLTRAIAKLRKHLEHYTFCSGDADQDFETRQKVLELADRAASVPTTFDETVLFQDPAMLDLKEDFKTRFRNVSRLMDCVGCDKCRLWGKVQTAGYGAALKVLFEFDETKNGENPHLRRTELVALVNTLGRVSHSLNSIQRFRVAVALGDLTILDESIPLPIHSPARPAESSISPSSSLPPAESSISSSSPSSAQPSDPEDSSTPPDLDSGWDGLEDDPYTSPTDPYPESVSEAFWTELDLVWRAYKFVLSSWINFPFKFGAILVSEAHRGWRWFIGLPSPPRSWELRFPTRDEL